MKRTSPAIWNIRRTLAVLLAAMFLLLTATACGGGSSGSSGGYAASYAPSADSAYYEADEEAYYEYPAPQEAYYGGENGAARSASAVGGTEASSALPKKLIRTATLEMETTEFDNTAAALDELVTSLEGYFSDVSSGDRGGSRRYSSYTIRLPAKNFKAFLDQVGEICHETWRDVEQEDISERYYDTEGRLRTQNTKLNRLRELLNQAENMEDIITIESAISETEERIEELSGTLSHWDNLVDYATITLSLQEVYRLSNIPETPDSYGSRLASAFVDGLRNFGEWVEDLTISLAYSWLWWVLLAAIVIGVLKLSRSAWWMRKMEARKARQEERRAKAEEQYRARQAARYGGVVSAPAKPEEKKDGDGKAE